MGYPRIRPNRNGKPRYQAIYRDHLGRERSAGTFSTKTEANHAWQNAEAKVRSGHSNHLSRGKVSFRSYVEEQWLPHHVIEATTRQSYTYCLYANVMDFFGDRKMRDILPDVVREWVSQLVAGGMTAATVAYYKTLLSSIFATAVEDEVVINNPCLVVKVPPSPEKPRKIVTPEQFDHFHEAIKSRSYRLLVEVAVETGMRWGELAELRPKDIDQSTRMVTVSRVVCEVNPKFHPNGGRFLVKDYPKGRKVRQFKISESLTAKIRDYVGAERLAEGDMLFAYEPLQPTPNRLAITDLGWTKPNAAGRTYRHGTPTAYGAGKCRCEHCRASVAAYRAGRRAAGKDQPRKPRIRDTTGYIPRDWFRRSIIKPALKEAQLGIDIKMHDLRHAHASWLLRGGADLQVVKDRLGHASITTTEKYLHTLPHSDETALDALESYRSGQSTQSDLSTVMAELDQIKKLLGRSDEHA